MSENIIDNNDAIENHKDVEERIEEIETANPMELVEENATGDNHQVTLSVDPSEPDEEVTDAPLTAAEKAADKEFDEVIAHIEEEALPELEHTIKSENLSDSETGGGNYTGGYNPEEEGENSELVKEVLDVSKVETAEFVVDEIVNAEDTLNVEVEVPNQELDVLVETEDDKTEDVTNKVENLTTMSTDGVLDAAIEDASNELTSVVEELHDNIGVGDSDQEMPEELVVDDQEENVPEYDEVSENAQVGDFTVTSIQTVTPEGVDNTTTDIDILSVDENPLDDCDTGEVIHTGTSDTTDLPSDLQKEINSIIETGTEGDEEYDEIVSARPEYSELQADLDSVYDEFESTDKDYDEEVDVEEMINPTEVHEGDFTEIVMTNVVEANPDIDLVAIDDFEAKLESSDNPDAVEAEYRYVLDETPEIVKEEGPLLGDPLTEHMDQLDKFISGEDAEIVSGSVDED